MPQARLMPWSRAFIDSMLCACLIVIESIQALLFVSWILRWIPPQTRWAGLVFPEQAALLRAEHEGLLYLLFVGLCAVNLLVIPYILEKRWGKESWRAQLKPFLAVEAGLTVLLLSALFKTVVYEDHPEFARNCYGLLLVAALLNKMFWGRITRWGSSVASILAQPGNQPALRKFADIAGVILVVVVLYLPNPEASLGRMFMGEQLHHFDMFVMAPGWASLCGGVLFKDAVSQYGVGVPIVLSHLAQWLPGGFTYLNTFLLIVWSCVVYYVLSYIFLRMWLGSIALAITGILIGIRTSMFHPGVLPFSFTYPDMTPVRYVWDIVFFLLVFFHLRNRRPFLLVLAALVCGFSTFYLESTGICMTVAFFVYLLAHLLIDDLRPAVYTGKKDIPQVIFYVLLAPALAVLLFFWAEGTFLFSPVFWQNSHEYVEYFLNGAGMAPMNDSLITQNFLDALLGFLIPLVYMFTMLLVGTLCYLRKIKSHNVLAVVLCVYGLGMYQYYVTRSSSTNFYVVGLPFVWILCYWSGKIWQHLSIDIRRRAGMAIAATALYALMTNHMFIAYPNMLNWTRNPLIDPRVTQIPPARTSYLNHLFREYPEAFKLRPNSSGNIFEGLFTERDFLSDDEVKSWFRQEFDFTQDAALISRLVAKDQKAAVVSSFEVKMLMQAGRAPFFYYLPLVISRPTQMRMFPVSSLYTVRQFEKTVDQIEKARPQYVFMERIFLRQDIPAEYYDNDPAFMGLLRHVLTHYEPVEYGKLLVAMKRKAP